MKKQLAETFTKLESSLLDKEDILAPYDINFVVSGTDEKYEIADFYRYHQGAEYVWYVR